MKYNNVNVAFIRDRSLIIHPMWVIDEYAIIDRKLDWFIPINPPIIALNTAIIINIY